MDTETGTTDLLAVAEWAMRVVGTALMTGAVIAGLIALVGVLTPWPMLLALAPWVGIATTGLMLRTS